MENVSTNRIVANSGISKGSFYQYFEDKQDVFMYLLTVLEQEKMEYFKGKHPPSANMDTFQYFCWMIKTGMEFNSSHPLLTQAISRVMFSEGMYYGRNFSSIWERTARGLRAMIEQAIARGEVDPSVDVDLAVMIMETWTNAQLNLNTLRAKYNWLTGKPSETDIAITQAKLSAAQAAVQEAEWYLDTLKGEQVPPDASGMKLAQLQQARDDLTAA